MLRVETCQFVAIAPAFNLWWGRLHLSKAREPGLSCGAVWMILHLAVSVEHQLVTDRDTMRANTCAIQCQYRETKIRSDQNRWLLRHSNWLISFSCDLLLMMCCASVAYNGSTVYCWKKTISTKLLSYYSDFLESILLMCSGILCPFLKRTRCMA